MKEKIKKIIFLVIIFLIVFIFPQNLFSDSWLKVDIPEGS